MTGRIRRCEKSELPVDQCAHCLGHTDPERDAARQREQLLEQPGWFPARFPGMCEHCGEPFTAGTPIRMFLDRGWRAECCADQPRTAPVRGRRR